MTNFTTALQHGWVCLPTWVMASACALASIASIVVIAVVFLRRLEHDISSHSREPSGYGYGDSEDTDVRIASGDRFGRARPTSAGGGHD